MGASRILGKCIAAIAIGAATLAPNFAHALNGRVYQSSLSGGNYTPFASVGTATAFGPAAALNTASGQRSLVNNAQSAYLQLQTLLNDELMKAARSAASGVSPGSATVQMGVASGILSGTMAIDVAGSVYSGDVTVSISGLRYVTSLAMHYKLGAWLDADCGVSVVLDNIRVVSSFNPITYAATSPASVWYDMSHSESCDSNFWWFPGVYSLIDNELKRKIGESLQPAIAAGQSWYFGRIVNANPSLALFSMLGAVTPGTYVLPGYGDVGSSIINTVTTTPALFYQKTLRVSVPQPASFFVPTLWNNNPGPSQRTGTAIRVDFCDVVCSTPPASSQPAFGVKLTQYFSWTLIEGEE